MKKDDEAAALSQTLFHKNAQEFKTKDELAVYAMTMAALGVAMLRGIEGHKFTRGFLIGAINDENPVVIRPEKLN